VTAYVKQPSAHLTRKQFWTLMMSTAATIICWGINEYLAPLPIEISGSIIIAAGQAAGYVVKERTNAG
jgi:hypothetical protein